MLADWDARLMTPARALDLAGDWPIYYSVELAELAQYGDQPDQWQINQRCGKCGQSCGLVAAAAAVSPAGGPLIAFSGSDTTSGDLLSGVLRHLVTAHDLSLSAAPGGEPT